MGTHPIFESDFDCLTVMSLWESIVSDYAEAEPKPSRKDDTDEDHNTNSAETYFNKCLKSVVTEGLIAMVNAAEKENVFKYKKRNKFNGCDFLTEYLYNNNPRRPGRVTAEGEPVPLHAIPFCSAFDKIWPRSELRLSLRLTADEAATMIQAWYRGVKTRQRAEVVELIKYQKTLRSK